MKKLLAAVTVFVENHDLDQHTPPRRVRRRRRRHPLGPIIFPPCLNNESVGVDGRVEADDVKAVNARLGDTELRQREGLRRDPEQSSVVMLDFRVAVLRGVAASGKGEKHGNEYQSKHSGHGDILQDDRDTGITDFLTLLGGWGACR